MTNRLLIVDFLNNFLRHYTVNPTLSNQGSPIGGIIGFLNSLQGFVRDMSPTQIIIAHDGPGGSTRRRQNNKNYKSNRKPIKMNWNPDYLGGDKETLENKVFQMTTLFEMLELLPITQFLIDGIEADDIISYVVQLSRFDEWQKIIISSDQDFIQLLNKRVILYRPIKQEIYNTNKILEKFSIHPNNFLLARSICGDKSDNLHGVDGAGLPTVAKRFPILLEEKQYLIEDIMKACEKEIEQKTKIKLYKNVLDNRGKIEDNYDLMQLCIPKIPVSEALKIQEQIKNKKLTFQKTEFIKMMSKVGFSINLDGFTINMNKLVFQ